MNALVAQRHPHREDTDLEEARWRSLRRLTMGGLWPPGRINPCKLCANRKRGGLGLDIHLDREYTRRQRTSALRGTRLEDTL